MARLDTTSQEALGKIGEVSSHFDAEVRQVCSSRENYPWPCFLWPRVGSNALLTSRDVQSIHGNRIPGPGVRLSCQ